MTDQKFFRVDKIKWWLPSSTAAPVPICPQHDMRMEPTTVYYRSGSVSIPSTKKSKQLKCLEGPHFFDIPREFSEQQKYIQLKHESKIFSTHTFITIDDETIPVAKEELKDSEYWVRAKVTESAKSGLRLIVWAGDKKRKNKTQLFVESDLKRLSFDQNDTHPSEIFAIVEAKFKDGIIQSITEKA